MRSCRSSRCPSKPANRRNINGCIKEGGATFLTRIGIRDMVRDMDVIRATIGDKKMTYIGYKLVRSFQQSMSLLSS